MESTGLYQMDNPFPERGIFYTGDFDSVQEADSQLRQKIKEAGSRMMRLADTPYPQSVSASMAFVFADKCKALHKCRCLLDEMVQEGVVSVSMDLDLGGREVTISILRQRENVSLRVGKKKDFV